MSTGWADWLAIVTAINRFGAILDSRAWDRLDEVVDPDATLYGKHGIPAIVEENLRLYLGGGGPTQHLLGNHDVTVDGDAATSHTRVRAYHRGLGEREGLCFETFGIYHDRWRRSPDGWRMIERELEVTVNVGDFEVLQPG